MNKTYECGEVVLCNGISGKNDTGYGVIVTPGICLGTAMVHQFIKINDTDISNVAMNTEGFLRILALMGTHKRFNIFNGSFKSTFIDVEHFFSISNIEIKSYVIETESNSITKLSDITIDEVLCPNGLIFRDNDNSLHEVVLCKDGIFGMLSVAKGVVTEYNSRQFFKKFSNDATVSAIMDLWFNKKFKSERGILSKSVLKKIVRGEK